MARPRKFDIPFHRPESCADCTLCGVKPITEVPVGSKWTHHCFLPGHEHDISGRGTKTTGLRDRNRCKPKEWQKVWITYNGTIELSTTIVAKYQIEPKLPFEPL